MILRWGIRCHRRWGPCSRHYSASIYRRFKQKELSDMFFKFISQERAALENAISTTDSRNPLNFTPSDAASVVNSPLSSLDHDIKMKLSRSVDSYAQLRLLLTYHPSRVSPQLYIYLYEKLSGEIGGNELAKLVQRLVYHRWFPQMWELILGEGIPTLSDVEDYIDIIYSQLKNSDYLDIGLLEIIESTKCIDNDRLRHSIEDTIITKFKIKRPQSKQIYHDLIAQKSNFNLSKNIQTLSHTPLCKFPGYILFILGEPVFQNNTDVDVDVDKNSDPFEGIGIIDETSELVDQIRRLHIQRLNSYDMMALINATPPLNRNILYNLCNKCSELDGGILDKLLGYMLKNGNDLANIIHCLQTNMATHDFPSKLLKSALVHIYVSSPLKFETFISKFAPSEYIDELLKKLKLLKGDKISDDLVYLIKLLEKSGRLEKSILKQLLKSIPVGKQLRLKFAEKLLELPLSNQSLIVITKIVFEKWQISDIKVLTILFNKLLYLSWNKEEMLPKSLQEGSDVKDDFRSMYLVATEEEKKKLNKSLEQFAHGTNKLETKELIKIINSLYKYIHRISSSIEIQPEFEFTNSKFGKEYILNKILVCILQDIDYHAIQKKDKDHLITKLQLQKMKDILMGLEFNSPQCQAIIYQFLVKYDPQTSIQLIIAYKDKKALLTNLMMKNIMKGILTSPTLDNHEKLHVYRTFRSALQQLGYKNTRHSSTIIYLLEILHLLPVGDPNKDFDLIKLALDLAKNQNLPPNIIKSWSRKLGI